MKKGLELALALDDKTFITANYGNLAVLNKDMDKLEDAENYLLKQLELAKKIGLN